MGAVKRINGAANDPSLILAGRVMQLIGIPIALWYLYNSNVQLDDATVRLARVETKVESAMIGLYRSEDARRDFKATDNKIDAVKMLVDVNKDNITDLKGRVTQLEAAKKDK